MQAKLDAARALWEKNGPDKYTFDLAWLCFCPNSGNITRISVENGQIVSAVNPSTGQPVDESYGGRQMTVDELFDWIQTGLDTDSGNVLELSFERDLGYPISASVDWIVGALDDESAFQVSNFRPDSQTVDLEQLHKDNETAMFRWFDDGFESYEFIFRWQCFCPPEANAPVRIRVEGGQIVSTTDPVTGDPVQAPGGLEYQTVMNLFGWIFDQIDRNPDFAALEFDAETGYPKAAEFNPIIQAADEEQAFFIEELTPLNIHGDVQADLDAARANWAALGVTSYTYEFNWQCFCLQEFVEPVRITVTGGEVTGVVRVENDEPVAAERLDDYETVDALFDRVQDAIDKGAASIRAEFDSENGLPNEVFIDFQSLLADEELGWNASLLVSTP